MPVYNSFYLIKFMSLAKENKHCNKSSVSRPVSTNKFKTFLNPLLPASMRRLKSVIPRLKTQ